MSPLDISIISKYVKSCNDIDTNNIQDMRLPQSKLYLKILSILYIKEGTNMPINSEVMEIVIKSMHIFNNVNIVFKSHIVKIFPKSNMAIVWIDIWNFQSSTTAKTLINRCFNIGSFVATIHSTNMNPGIP